MMPSLVKNDDVRSGRPRFVTGGTGVNGLSIVQNGKIPQFFSEDQLHEIFKGKSSSPAIVNLQKGLAKLGIYQVEDEQE